MLLNAPFSHDDDVHPDSDIDIDSDLGMEDLEEEEEDSGEMSL
jgi:hypothetical protein